MFKTNFTSGIKDDYPSFISTTNRLMTYSFPIYFCPVMNKPCITTHSGEVLMDKLNARGLKKMALARQLEVDNSVFSDILRGKKEMTEPAAWKLEAHPGHSDNERLLITLGDLGSKYNVVNVSLLLS